MRIHADFTRRAVVAGDRRHWIASPQAGVERVMLDRIGGEAARATSIVRYAPDSHFPAHPHPGGEEILVLAGVFSEGARDYPAGWYLRNPPGSSHRPSSAGGATLFVKLRQMPAGETRAVRVDTRDPAAWLGEGAARVCPLFESAHERVMLRRLAPGARLDDDADVDASGLVEWLVIDGALRFDVPGTHQHAAPLGPGSWLRLPDGDRPACRAGEAGLTVYLKHTAAALLAEAR